MYFGIEPSTLTTGEEMKVKVFTAHANFYLDLENEINSWLAKMGSGIVVESLTQSQCGSGIAVIICFHD